ncbi:MAG: alginate export family protein [Candidatus Scalindua sp.]|nr:alginate export family protein [Candidatus Scalindua sp.]
MMRIKNYFIIFVAVFAITSACAFVSSQDVKAEDSMSDLIKRIEALESKPANAGNVTAGKIKGLKIGLNLRHRYENRTQDFSRTRADAGTGAHGSRQPTKDFTLQRMRLSFDADINKNVMARVMFQDARTFGEHHNPSSTTSSNITSNLQRTDVQEAYVQLRSLGDITPILSNVQIRAGRWQQGYGNHRQIGTLGWANQSRSYDGAKVMYKKDNLWVDVFAWQIHENITGGVDGGGILGAGSNGGGTAAALKDSVMYGVYSQYKFGGSLKGNLVEPFLIVKAESTDEDRAGTTARPAKESRYSFGFRAAGKNIEGLGGFDYTIEPVLQRGNTQAAGVNKRNNINAWAIHAETGYTFKNVAWTPRIGYAYSYASGDDNPNGNDGTFRQISPTQHAHNGYMDITSWQNIRDHQIHLNLKPTKKLVVDVKAHFFSLDEVNDAWYHVGGTGTNRAAAAGSNGTITNKSGNTERLDTDLAQEIDITLKYKLFKNFGVVAGYSHLFADDYIEDTGGGIDRGVDWFYLQTTVKF